MCIKHFLHNINGLYYWMMHLCVLSFRVSVELMKLPPLKLIWRCCYHILLTFHSFAKSKMLTVEMFSIGQHNKTKPKKRKKSAILCEWQFSCIPWSTILKPQHACGRHDPRELTLNIKGVCSGGPRLGCHWRSTLSWKEQFLELFSFSFFYCISSNPIEADNQTTPERIEGDMARGEGAEQCAATLLSVKAVNAESKSSTVRFVMNEPRMPAGTHADLTHLVPGSGLQSVPFNRLVPAVTLHCGLGLNWSRVIFLWCTSSRRACIHDKPKISMEDMMIYLFILKCAFVVKRRSAAASYSRSHPAAIFFGIFFFNFYVLQLEFMCLVNEWKYLNVWK